MKKSQTTKLVMAALLLAIGQVLPFVTGNIPAIGKMLSPMHIPVLLAGYVCGAPIAAAVGAICPILRSILFGMPMMMPGAICMAFELATYGFVAGSTYQLLKKEDINVFVSLILAMIAGRIVWGVAAFCLYNVLGMEFTLKIFAQSVFLGSIPGIICHLIVIPSIVIALRKLKFIA